MAKKTRPRYSEIDHEQAAAIVAEHAPALAKSIDFAAPEYSDGGDEQRWTIRLYEGPLTVDGNFTIDSETVLVRGDLTVEGTLFDCWDAERTMLVVLGNLSVRNALLQGQLHVRGNLHCQELVLANSSNDYSIEIGGELRARAVVETGMHCVIRGALEAEVVLSSHNTILVGQAGKALPRSDAKQAAALARRILAEDYLDGHDLPNQSAIRDKLRKSKSVLLKRFASAGAAPTRALSKAAKAAIDALRRSAESGALDQIVLPSGTVKSLPSELREFSGVRVLRLAGNQLGELPEWLSEFEQLEQLDLHDCRLTHLPPWLGRLPKLRVLRLSQNALTDLNAPADGFQSLQSLAVGHPYGQEEPNLALFGSLSIERFPSLLHLELSRCHRMQLPPALLAQLRSASLEYLDVGPELAELPPIAGLPRLRWLDICSMHDGEAIERSAEQALALAPQLEVLTVPSDWSDAMLARLHAARPQTYLRFFIAPRERVLGDTTNLADRAEQVIRAWDARYAAYDETLTELDGVLARFASGRPLVNSDDYERLLYMKLWALRARARHTGALQAPLSIVEAAAGCAQRVLETFSISSARHYYLSSLGLDELITMALLTKAWWLLRRSSHDRAGDVNEAMELVARIETAEFSSFQRRDSNFVEHLADVRALAA